MKLQIILATLFLFLAVSLSASELDDLKFAAGLFADGNSRLAKAELENFIQNYPQSRFLDDAKYLLANTYFQQENYAAAAEIYSALRQSNFAPNLQAELILGLAQSYFGLQQYSQAQQLFQEFLTEFAQHEKSSEAYYYLGKMAERAQDYPEALQYYDSALATARSKHSKIQAARLKMLIKLDKEQQVDDLYELILRESTGDYRDYAIVLWLDYKLQQADYQKILARGLRKIRPDSAYFSEYKMLLGICYYETDDLVKAREYLAGLAAAKAQYYFALASLDAATAEARSILQKLANSSDQQIATNSKFYLAKITPDLQQARAIFQDFIEQNPQHKFLGAAYFHLGFSYFKQAEFSAALPHLQQAEKLQLSANNRERLLFMLAESNYQLNDLATAEQYLQQYLQNSEHQLFRDEAIFKQALRFYANQDYLPALEKFQQLADFPESDKLAMSYFYQGEIYLLQGKLSSAKAAYEQALAQSADSGFVNLRLAKIALQLDQLAATEKYLQQVPNAEKYRFDRNLILGNLALQRAEYPAALQRFLAAEEYSSSDQELELIISQKAWTLYQMKKFEQASSLYQQLSGMNLEAAEYILKAANAAFSAEKYQTAINLFQQYSENFPERADVMSARLAVADSYYNLQNYQQALQNYRELFLESADLKILRNALNGMRWSCNILPQTNLDEEIDLLLAEVESRPLKLLLLAEKIDFLFQNENWQQTIEAVQAIAKLKPESAELYQYQMKQAISYAQLSQLDQARALFAALEKVDLTADLYYNWAIMELQDEQRIAALSLLKKGAAISQRTDIWLKLLQLQPLEMRQYYQQFSEFAPEYAARQADLYWNKWRIEQNDFEVVEALENLKKSQYADIKASAQYLLGYRLYQQQAYDEAIRELLRVRYLYPEINDVRLEAEYLACLSYIEAGRREEAQTLYDSIQNELSADKRAELAQLLSGAE
ncbi:MAG: tetratricopeptide repeat protein [Candidatus Cloacimonadales bacterium]